MAPAIGVDPAAAGAHAGAGPRRWPLTGAQEGVWLAQALSPEDPVFNTADAVELVGPVDEARLAAEIRTVLSGAEALHVRFEEGPRGPLQVERGGEDWPLPVLDLRADPDPAASARAYMDADLRTPVALGTDRLFHTALLRTGPEAWTWYLRIHHIATDAYATALLMRRVAARCAAGADPAAPLDLAGLDALVDADLAYRAADQHQADRALWASRLEGHVAPPSLANGAGAVGVATPAATAAATTSGVGPPRPVRATAHLDAPLAQQAAVLGAGWPELLVAGVAANLESLTGAGRQVLAMPVLARSGPVRKAPGIAVNIVPLVVTVDPAAPLSALVGEIRDELRATRKHQRLRFEEMARMVPADVPLFGPQINLKPYVSALQIGDAAATIRNLATGPVDDLSLIATDLPGGGFALSLDGHGGRYTQAEVEAQLARLVETLQACARAGALDEPVGALPTITAPERALVLDGFNATEHPVAATTLTALLREQAARTPDLPAVTDARETVTYAELHARAERLAAALRRRGAGPESIVGLGLRRSVGLSVAVVASQLAGAAYLPLDPELPADRLAYVLGDAAPACVVVGEGVASDTAALALPGAILIDEGGEIVREPEEPQAQTATSAAAPTPASPAYVIYTSGSTGKPKGVVNVHSAIVNRLAWQSSLAPIGPGDHVLQKTPYSFDVSVWELVWPLIHGARLVMAEPGGHRDPQYLAALVQREGITVLHFVPSMLDLFLDEPGAAGCASLRHVICSGEALPAPTVARYHERLAAPLHNLYGPTEAAIDVTSWTCDPADASGVIPIGRPIWNTRTYVLDGAGRPVPVGVAGELFLAGAGLAREYLGRTELTAERFVPDPFHAGPVEPGAREPRMYRTGDVARWRPDGAIEYLGRTDDQVKLRGQRIELGEIEAALASHPLVARAAAAIDRAGGAPRLVAYVVPGLAAEPEAGALAAHLAQSLPDVMVPTAFAIVDDLPLSPNGKLDRRLLPPIDTRPADGSGADGAPPATPLEQRLCELMGELLGIPPIAATQSLFDLGGDSLLAARLAALIRTTLGIDLALGAIFAAPTPEALAARMGDGGDLAALEPLLTLRGGGDRAPLFCLHPAGGIGWCYAGLARTIRDRPILALQAATISGGILAPSIDALAIEYADRIETAHPTGPCHLLGWSVGGVIAEATARELQARGRETGVVALLDAYPGEQWADQAPPTRTDTLLALLYMGGLDTRALLGHDPTLATVLEALGREGSALASLGAETFERMADTVLGTSRLMREHRTQPVAGDLLFFLAGAPRAEAWLDADAWREHVGGALTIHALACTHPEMPRRGPLDEIAGVVARALVEAEPGRRTLADAASR